LVGGVLVGEARQQITGLLTENDGPSELQGMKLQCMKLRSKFVDKIVSRETLPSNE